MSRLRQLRRWAAGDTETLRSGIFAAHRERFQHTTVLVRAFYAAQVVHLQTILEHWTGWLDLERLEGLWPLAWAPVESPQVTIAVVAGVFAAGIFSAALCPERTVYRLLNFLGLLLAGALDNSFGKIDHGFHAWIYVAFVLIFLPQGGSELGRSIGARQRYLLVFAGAQASFLMTYSLAGFWKLHFAIQQAQGGGVSAFSPQAFAYLAADRLLQTSSQSVLGPLVIEAPEPFWPLLLAGIYIELIALVVVFRPALLRLWGALICALHLGSLLILTVPFLSHMILAVILLIAAPGATGSPTWRSTIANLPPLPLLRAAWGMAPSIRRTQSTL